MSMTVIVSESDTRIAIASRRRIIYIHRNSKLAKDSRDFREWTSKCRIELRFPNIVPCISYSGKQSEAVITGTTELINPFIKAAAEDHTDADCLVVAAMSHGESGVLYAADNVYPVEMLWTPFLGHRCPSLVGKPKLFFIQVSCLLSIVAFNVIVCCR